MDESGNIDGYAEENENTEERFNPGGVVDVCGSLKGKVEEEKLQTEFKMRKNIITNKIVAYCFIESFFK